MPTGFDSGDTPFSSRRRDFDPEWLVSDAENASDPLWELLSAYSDGEATPEETAQVEAMLRADPAYARHLEFLKLTAAGARDYVEVEPPASLRDAIFAATTRRRTFAGRVAAGWDSLRRALAPNGTAYAFAAGGLAAAAIVGFVFWPRTQTVAPPGHPSVTPGLTNPSLVATNRPSEPLKAPGVKPGGNPTAPPMMTAQNHSKSSITRSRGTERGSVEPVVELVGLQNRAGRMRRNRPEARVALANPTRTPHLKPIHYPKIDEADASITQVAYTQRPGMDAINQRQSWPMSAGDSASPLNENVVTTERSAGTEKSGGPPASNAGSETSKENAKSLTRHYGRILAQLPPDPRLIVSNNDLKRQHAAATLGYDRDTLESIQRRQATVSLISSRF